MNNKSLQQKLLKNIIKSENDCWIWNKSKDKDGYGAIMYKSIRYKAHRASYIAFIGSIPNNMCVCHACDNPSCINPNHLFIGTHKDNLQDMSKKGRSNKSHGVKHYKSYLSKENVLDIRKIHINNCL